MSGCAKSKSSPRPRVVYARARRHNLATVGYLAPSAGLISVPKLHSHHSGQKIGFGTASLNVLAQSLVENGLANEADWREAKRSASGLVDLALRRFLADRSQATIVKHFELALTLGESIVDSAYGESEPTEPGQLFFVLNTESSFPICVGRIVEELDSAQAGLGRAFYESLRHSLYRWVRVYDDSDTRYRLEQTQEWAEEEAEGSDSFEIPKLEPDMPSCLLEPSASDRTNGLIAFPLPGQPRLRKVVELTLELERISNSSECPKVDEDFLERERSYHSLDAPLPAVLMYFRPGDAVMACFDNECEFWGQETPEPNLIVPFRPKHPGEVCKALSVIDTLMRLLVLTIKIKKLIELQEDSACASESMSEAKLN